MSPLPQAIRLLPTQLLYLTCNIKPSVSATRVGIRSITENFVNINIAAQPRDGEANIAVREMIARILRVQKSDVEIIRGEKGRMKVVGVRLDGWKTFSVSRGGVKDEGEVVEKVRRMLLGLDDDD